MALTANTTFPLNDKFGIGKMSSVSLHNFTSDVALTGQVIYLEIGQFANVNSIETQNVETPPQNAYYFTYPASGIVVPEYQGDGQGRVSTISVTINSATDFTVSYAGFYLADVGGYYPGPWDNSSALTRNHIFNQPAFNNGYPSVYNQTKWRKLRATHDDGTNQKPYAVSFEPISLRFWGLGLLGAAPELTEFVYILLRDGTVAPNLSTEDPTTIRFSVDGSVDNTQFYGAGLFRLDQVESGIYPPDGISLFYGEVNPSTGAISGVNGSNAAAFSSATTLAQNSSGRWQGDVTIDPAQLADGATYRFYVIVPVTGGITMSFVTNELTTPALANPSFGTITHELSTFTKVTDKKTTTTVEQLAPLERVLLIVTMDADEYNESVVDNNANGTFQNNLDSVSFAILENPPVKDQEIAARENLPVGSVVNFVAGSNREKARLLFRIPDDWAGLDRYIVCIWRFKLNKGTGQEYSDTIYYPVKIKISPFGVLTLQVLDDQNQPIDLLCDGILTAIKVRATYSGLTGNFNPIAIIEREGDLQEDDGYQSPDGLPQLSSNLISPDESFVGNQADVLVFPPLLQRDTPYAVTVIAKREQPVITPPTCGTYASTFSLTVANAGSNSSQVGFTFTVTQGGVVAGDIESFSLSISQGLQAINKTIAGNQLSFTENFTALDLDGSAEIAIRFDVTVNVTDKCVFQGGILIIIKNATFETILENVTLS